MKRSDYTICLKKQMFICDSGDNILFKIKKVMVFKQVSACSEWSEMGNAIFQHNNMFYHLGNPFFMSSVCRPFLVL